MAIKFCLDGETGEALTLSSLTVSELVNTKMLRYSSNNRFAETLDSIIA